MDNYACTNLTHRYDGVFLSMFAYCCIALLCVFVFVLGMQEFSAKLLQRIGLMSLDLRMSNRWEEMLKDGEEDIDNDSRGEDGDENKNNDTNEDDSESKDKDDVSHEEERDDLVDIGLTIVHEDGREEHKRGVARILKLEVVVKCMPEVNGRQNSSEGGEEDKKGDDDDEDETDDDVKEENGDGQKETEKETEEEGDDDEKEEGEEEKGEKMKEEESDDDEKEMEEGEEEDRDEDEDEGEEETEEEKSAGDNNAVTEVLPEIIEIVRSCTRGVAGKMT